MWGFIASLLFYVSYLHILSSCFSNLHKERVKNSLFLSQDSLARVDRGSWGHTQGFYSQVEWGLRVPFNFKFHIVLCFYIGFVLVWFLELPLYLSFSFSYFHFFFVFHSFFFSITCSWIHIFYFSSSSYQQKINK